MPSPSLKCKYCGRDRLDEGAWCNCPGAIADRERFEQGAMLPPEPHPGNPGVRRSIELPFSPEDVASGKAQADKKRLEEQMDQLFRPQIPWAKLVEDMINYFEKSRKNQWSRVDICMRLNMLHREFVAKHTREAP